jgi:DNA-binding winged helix-turn-helix (wHTH) protein
MSPELLANHPRPAGPAPPQARYRFGSVEVDTGRGTLTVGDQPVELQPLAFRLLVLLCEARGAVVPRDALLQRLWPEQVVVSDESLTKCVHRLRQALGPEGARVRTLRKVGVRLDVVLNVFPPPSGSSPRIAMPAASPLPMVSPEATPVSPLKARTHSWLWLSVAVLLVCAGGAVASFRWLHAREPLTDAGYGIQVDDLSASRGDTSQLVNRALVAAAAGNRPHARALLEAVHGSDPTTPIAAVLLAIWARGPGAEAIGRHWSQAAAARLNPTSSPYQRLLVEYADRVSRDDAPGWEAAASAILDQRPDAWALRLARAHFHLSRRDWRAALVDLQRIPVHRLPSLNMALVLGDRASLGDANGVESDLAGTPLAKDPALGGYVRGRIAWSQGRTAEALHDFEQSVDEATLRDQPDLQLDARVLAAAMSAELDQAEARPLFDQIVAHARAQKVPLIAVEALGMGAYLSARAGDTEGRDRRLAEAFSLSHEELELSVALALAAFETGGVPAEDVIALGKAVRDTSPELLGVPELLAARSRLAARRPAEAARLLLDARARGVERSYYAESATLLGAELGQATSPCKVDPPYPNVLRFGTCDRLRQILAASPRTAQKRTVHS